MQVAKACATATQRTNAGTWGLNMRQEAFNAHVAENRDGTLSPLPYTHRQWLEWFNGYAFFRGLLKKALGTGKQLSNRIVPTMPLPPAPRLQPTPTTLSATHLWLKKLGIGCLLRCDGSEQKDSTLFLLSTLVRVAVIRSGMNLLAPIDAYWI